MKENSTNNWKEMTRKHNNNRMQKKQNNFGKNMATKKHNEQAEWINNMTKELEGLKEIPKAEIHIDLLKTTLKISNWKATDHDGIHGFWFKKFPPFTTHYH